MTIHEDYFNYTIKWKREYGEKTIVFIQVGSFYEVYALQDENGKIYGSNISEYSKINDLVIAKKHITVRGPIKDVVGEKKGYQLIMAGFGLTQIDKYVGRMQEHGYTIVLYDQDIQGKNTSRSRAEIISPGTYFAQNTMNPSNHTMCIWMERSRATKTLPSQISVGISWIDIFTGKTRITQFTREYNHNPCTYDELERIVAINNPSECILISEQAEDYLDDIINFAGISSLKIHKITLQEDTDISKKALHAQKQIYQQSVFERFFPAFSSDHIILEMPTHFLAIQAFVFLLDFIYTQNPNLVDKLSLPSFETTSDTLILANHSLQQLNMIDDHIHNGKLSSVSSLLNHCVTTMGKRKFLYNLHNPITDVDQLQLSYNITEHVIDHKKWNRYREYIAGVHDLEKLKRKIVIKKITPKDLAILVTDLRQIFSLHEEVQTDAPVLVFAKGMLDQMRGVSMGSCGHSREIKDLCSIIIEDIDRHFYIDKCIEIAGITPEYFGSLSIEKLSFVKPGMCDEIDDLLSKCVDARKKLESISSWLSGQIGTIEKKKSSNFIKIHETPKSDPMLMGTKRRMKLLQEVLRKQNKSDKKVVLQYTDFMDTSQDFVFDYGVLEYVTMGSNKTGLVVTSDNIRKLTSQIQQAESKLVSATITFYRDYVTGFVKFQKHIDDISNFVTIIDLLQCKGYIAEKYNYCKPTIQKRDKSYFDMKAIRHPLIEHLQAREIYVTNDLAMGDMTSEDAKNGLLLYGTNAVGKTSLIKSIGINIIMAQAGLYVACSSFEYSPYHAMFTRILGNDNIFKGLSTFEVEMSELSTILKLADENSIILGDELCSGTESDSALSIFTASLESLHSRKSTFLFATHFHEIQNYDEIDRLDGLTSKHMEVTYNREKDQLIYDRKLRDGPGDSMYGLEVCKALHLPDTFLNRAHSIRMKYNNKTKNVLDERGSHYNTQKLGGLCEMCKKKRGVDTHHLQHQKSANDKGFIGSFHKNHKANLMTLCQDCHAKIHEADDQHVKVKTTGGYELHRV
jgi:DNA mismatch repair protein MutS